MLTKGKAAIRLPPLRRPSLNRRDKQVDQVDQGDHLPAPGPHSQALGPATAEAVGAVIDRAAVAVAATGPVEAALAGRVDLAPAAAEVDPAAVPAGPAIAMSRAAESARSAWTKLSI